MNIRMTKVGSSTVVEYVDPKLAAAVAQLIYVWQGIADPVKAQQIMDQVVACAEAAYWDESPMTSEAQRIAI
jgi:hypothetical protein